MERQDENRREQTRKFGKDDPKPGQPKNTQRDQINSGKSKNSNDRDEMKKHH